MQNLSIDPELAIIIKKKHLHYLALDWHQPIALIHDCLKVLPNDMDKAKERIKHGFVQVCKGDPLARLADEMEVSSEQLPRLTQGSGDLSAVLNSSSYMFN